MYTPNIFAAISIVLLIEVFDIAAKYWGCTCFISRFILVIYQKHVHPQYFAAILIVLLIEVFDIAAN
jgi:hypothetical protein